MSKQRLTTKHKSFSSIYLDGMRYPELVQEFTEFAEKMKVNIEDVFIDEDCGYGDNDRIFHLAVLLTETDAEMNARIERDKRTFEANKGWKLKQYEALKKELGL